MSFKYKVTVIIPIYNAEEFLNDCLDSLVAQTIDHDQMEVLLINDGSTDNSLAICQEYAGNYSIFKVFNKRNEGVSATRNFGIRYATGKYIMYLDADDTLSENTVLSVSNYFDSVYDKVDLVCYKERTYNSDGTPQKLHLRYNYLKSTGVYDLTKSIFASQVRLNIAVKNLLQDNFYFNEEIGYHEDQMYCTDILSDKLLLGYVNECEYRYNKHAGSITDENMNAMFLFEKTTAYWEHVFAQYEKVPKYLQALFFHDIGWKFTCNVLWPYHYSAEELQNARNRIITLLDKVDNSVIMSYPGMDNYQRLYWIRMKSKDNTCPIVSRNSLELYSDGTRLYIRNDVELVLKRVLVKNNTVKIVGFFKSPFFSYIDSVKLYAKKNGELFELERRASSAGYYKAKETTDVFWQLIYETEIVESTTLEFFVEIDSIMFPTVFYNCESTAFYSGFTQKYAVNSISIKQTKNGFVFAPVIDSDEIDNSIKDNSKKANDYYKELRNEYLSRPKRKVWLYYDNNTVEKDNGYYQFIHDVRKNDGIERYYVLTNLSYNVFDFFSEDLLPNVIEFGTPEHQMMFLMAEKILTSFIEPEGLFPFALSDRYQINDIFNAEIIYLQHGVLHAHLPWYYTPTKFEVDKVVVSTPFEINNFSSNYCFNKCDLIPTGMPRYEYINRSADDPKNRILFAPSWRGYLAGAIIQGNALRTGNDIKVLHSNYYLNLMRFIKNQRLNDFLEERNINLDLKLHPNFLQVYRHLINIDSNRIHIAPANVDLTDYSLFITDFSSYSFDYAYLSRPIMYFVPDYLEFKAGLNHYRELDLPFEKAFGNLTTEPETAVDEIIRIVENDFVPDKVFKERLDNFFLPLDNCEEELYKYLLEEN
ncbi:MAG: glycosyltransferase [Eubacterium sp.]|nr:glycosyltransferase [Eubacterium sp.]